MVEKPAPGVTVGLLLTNNAPITKSFVEAVVNDTDAVELLPVDVATVLRFGSNGAEMLAPLMPNVIITNL